MCVCRYVNWRIAKGVTECRFYEQFLLKMCAISKNSTNKSHSYVNKNTYIHICIYLSNCTGEFADASRCLWWNTYKYHKFCWKGEKLSLFLFSFFFFGKRINENIIEWIKADLHTKAIDRDHFHNLTQTKVNNNNAHTLTYICT